MYEQQYIEFYTNFSEKIKENSADILNVFRNKAFEKFYNLGFPTKKNEKYCYSKLPETMQIDYGLNINRLRFQIDKNYPLARICNPCLV